uniref:Leucine-rich repeat-containing protein 9 n=2 Tax=Callorhinchus milii TaxID=7868 RepID=A0A4W3GR10_CALMI
MENLVILDLYRNPLVNTQENYRLFIIYHLPALKALDGQAVESTECENAKDVFGGRLTSDMIAEKLGYSNVSELLKLELPDYAIRTVDLGPPKKFEHLQRINLERNNLTSFSGLIFLPTVKVLHLNYNHIESIFPRQKSQLHLTNRQLLQQKVTSSGYGQQTKGIRDVGVYGLLPPVMESLEVLHLAYNGISNLAQLELSRLTNLRTLFLQGNNITQIEGLDGLRYLVELMLSQNRIKMINANSFWSQGALVELHLEENRIRELNYLNPLVKLQRLFLGANKVQDIFSLEKLDGLSNLTELSMIDNPVTRKILYRPFLLFRLPRLQLLDGLAVTYEERERSELQLCEQNILTTSSPMEMTLPGLVAQLARPSPLRVTNVTLQGGVQHLIGQEFNVQHTFGDSISQETAKNKKYKHLAANLVSNIRAAHSENTLRQIKSGTNYQPSSFTQQQGGVSRNMHTFNHTQEQDGRCWQPDRSVPTGYSTGTGSVSAEPDHDL